MPENRPTSRLNRSKDRSVQGMVAVSSGLVLAALPLFMVGGLAVQIKEELDLTEATLGAAVTVGFVIGALSAPIGGRIADRVGPKTSIYVGNAMSVIALFGLGFLSHDWAVLMAFLCLAGAAVAITDPGLAILIDRAISVGRHGLAFGVKEASIPAATLAAGIAVPTIALTVGWRWGFALGLLPWTVVLVLLPGLAVRPRLEGTSAPHPVDLARRRRRALGLAAVGAALGTTAASGVGIFLTDSAVTMGLSPAHAGLVLAVGSVAGIVTRVATGVMADRTGGPQFKLIAVMLAIGALTMAVGGTGNVGLLILGTIGAFTGGWAWTGIFFLSLIKTNPDRPGAVAGIGTLGLGVGNAAGPLLFGIAAQSFSFETAWLVAALVAAVASLLMARVPTQV